MSLLQHYMTNSYIQKENRLVFYLLLFNFDKNSCPLSYSVLSFLAQKVSFMKYTIYLSGEIHSDWRKQIIEGCKQKALNVEFTSAVTHHELSDSAGDCLGAEDSSFWRDHKSAKVNAIRTQAAIKNCDLAVIRFGNKYKQWNAAFDAGFCAALNKPYITLHDEDLVHALKEVDGSAQAWAITPEQVVEILTYLTSK